LSPDISYQELTATIKGESFGAIPEIRFSTVAYDTRNLVDGSRSIFFALTGSFRDGHTFIKDAYDKGIRCFVVSERVDPKEFPNAGFITVENTLDALQELAAAHRRKFSYPVIAITGSAGKTTVKEWLYHLISPDLRVIRSPKSYNSQLGVALSLLELHDQCDVAIIEAGISTVGEMERLKKMIHPTHGIFCSFGRAHSENFQTTEQHLSEKLLLFQGVRKTYYPSTMQLDLDKVKAINGEALHVSKLQKELQNLPFEDVASQNNALLAIGVAKELIGKDKDLKSRIASLPRLALRMETFEGRGGNMIINDTYNLDLDALTHSLEYQLRVAEGRKRVVIIGLDEDSLDKKEKVYEILKAFNPDKVVIVTPPEKIETEFNDCVILIKGTRKADMQRYARTFRLRNHTTFVEIDLSAVRHNLEVFRKQLKPETKMLAMVKAQSYGSGSDKMAAFFEQQGVNYLGVAYADEGVELRKQGIKLPILVMNTEEEGFEDCIKYELEPAIFTLRQLDLFIQELILQGKTNYPIHLKLDTGMKRLGFEIKDLPRVCELIKSQPEVYIKSVYSHLADADNRRDKRFTEHQISQFTYACEYLQQRLQYGFLRHILNSEGASNFPQAQFDMIRLGIGMYGISSNPAIKRKLLPVLKWYSAVSQVKTLKKGESVGYGRTFVADKETTIAVIPVGYADGYRRSLSNGKGVVFINGKACPTVGRVCMDMIMVDVSGKKVRESDSVEIIGSHQSIEQFATAMDTIVYEVMTGISKRVHRVYLEE
jgi:Alr-MurF fusion protein